MRPRTLVIALIVLIGVMAFPQLALAAEPDPSGEVAAEAQGEPHLPLNVVLEVDFDENGEWIASVGIESPGMMPFPDLPNFIAGNLRLEDQSYASLNTLFGLLGIEMELPKASPGQVQNAVDAGLESIAITKAALEDGTQELRLYANDELLLVAEASDPIMAEALATLGVGDMGEWLLPLLTGSEATVIIRFPAEEMAEVTLEDDLEPSEGPQANVVSLGATVAERDGSLVPVSVAGFSIEEVQEMAQSMDMSLELPSIDTTLLSDFDVEDLAISVGPDGLSVDAGDGRLIKLGWDADSRAAAIEMLPAVGKFLDLDLGDAQQYLAQAEPWIADTGIEVNLHVGDTPQEGGPTLSIGKPIVVELNDDGGVIVEGFDLGAMGVTVDMGTFEPYLDALPLAAAWDGEDMQLRLSVAGAQMPYIAVNRETLPTVAGLFLSDSVPLDKVTAILEEADLALAVGLEGDVGVEEISLDHEVADAERAKLYAVPRLVIDSEGEFGFGDPPVRISSLLDGFGVDTEQVQDMARLYALGYGDDLDVVGITVDPAGLDLAIDRETALQLRWDEELRENLLGVVESYVEIPDIPFIDSILPDWKTIVLNALVGEGWGTWGLEVGIEDEIPQSGIESTLEALGLFKLLGNLRK